MADSSHDLRSNDDSALALFDDWSFSDDSALGARSLAQPGTDRSPVSSTGGARLAPGEIGDSGTSDDPAADFALDRSTTDETVARNLLATIDHTRPGSSSDAEPHVSAGSYEDGTKFGGGVLRTGAELAGFRILLELGRGAFARVYLAEELNLGQRLVAVKVSRPDGDEPRILARLQHAHIVPVHSVHDDEATGLRFLCMPYFGGADLARVLRVSGGLVPTCHDGRSLVKALDEVSRKLPGSTGSDSVQHTIHRVRRPAESRSRPTSQRSLSISGGLASMAPVSRFRGVLSRFVGSAPALPLPADCAAIQREEPSRQFLRSASAIQASAWIIARLAEGLAHAHDRGLLHRDLKPSNILLAADGTPMLLDFNLAVENPAASPVSEIHRALIGGTLPYMSPEHLDAFNPCGTTTPDAVDERSDIYALGLIFFELLAGAPTFPEPPQEAPLQELLDLLIACRRSPPSLRDRCPRVPWSLDALVARCLAFDPARRYARAADLAEDLRRFLDDLPMKHCPEPSIRERMGKWARRHPGLCGSTSIALVAVMTIGLLGGALTLVYDKMQELSARVQYHIFDRNFTESQFLLNTASGSHEHIKKGIEQAERTIAMIGSTIESPAHWAAWARRLTRQERQRLCEQLVELVMLEARARVVSARQHGSEEDWRRALERAIDRLDHAEHVDLAAPSALYAERARYHAALDHEELAGRDQKRSRQIIPATCHDLTLLATSRLSARDHAGAEQALKEALRLDVTSFWAWFVLGHCHFAQGRFLEAAGDFASCAVGGPEFAWVHFNRGLALARAGRVLEARYAYDRALSLEPTFSEALVNRGVVELELNELAAAQTDLRRSIELGRTDIVAFVSLGEALARMGRRDEAERFFARVLDRTPDSSVALVAWGFTRIATDPTGARNDLQAALKREPGHAHAHYGMALLLRRTLPTIALSHLDSALQSDPNLIDAVQLRALLRGRLGEPAVFDDVERLLESPTPIHLYNAACALAVYSDKAHEPRCVNRALHVLARALDSGFSPSEAAADPDLSSLRRYAGFERVLRGRSRR